MELDKSENAGLRVARVFADVEQEILKNRRALFNKAIKGEQLFSQGVLQNMTDFTNSNLKAIDKNIGVITELIDEEINASVDAGVTAIKKTATTFKEQGANIKDIQETAIEVVKERRKAITLAGILGVFATMLNSSNSQVRQIVSQVDDTKPNIAEQIDKAQNLFLKKGITGKTLNNGAEKEAYGEVEFLMRDFSHKTLLEAQGETAKQIGLNPLVKVSAHPSSCPLCQPWQGQVLIDDVYQGGIADGKHKLLSEAISAGLSHYNCRHNWVNYIEGLDSPNIFENEKQSKLKTAQNYAMEQRQREIERNIREYKRRASASLTKQAQLNAEQKVAEWQAVQRELIKSAEKNNLSIYRQYSREQIGGETKPVKRV